MNWYYVEAGQQAGPVDDAQLEELVRSGKIQIDTLVWHEGMSNWQPYHYMAPSGTAAAGQQPSSTIALAPGQAVCAECGGLFNVEDTIPYGNLRVCAKCKPVFMQKLAEGARLNTGQMVYAGFWLRFGAVFLDGMILGVINFIIGLIAGLGFSTAAGVQPVGAIALRASLMIVQLGIGLSYEAVMIGKFGATLGKMACKIKVVTVGGGSVSYPQALARYFAKLLSFMTCFIGYIMAGFDEEKRALHDRICGTRVIMNQ